MLALTQLPVPSATIVMVSRHDAVALHAGAARPGGQAMQFRAAPSAYVPGGHGVQIAAPPAAYVLALHRTGGPLPPAHDIPAKHTLQATNGTPPAGTS